MFKSFFEYRIENEPLKHIEENVLSFIMRHINPFNESTRLLDTSTVFNIEAINQPVHNIVNLRKLNFITDLNSLFTAINKKLYDKGIFIGCVEDYHQRQNRIYIKYPFVISKIVYFFDFIINRLMPKLSLTQKINIKKLKTSNRAISKSEILGRLYAAGFEINEYVEINNLTYFVAKKIKEPLKISEIKYGIFYRMSRVGKDNKIINVYKIRTMNPYSEFLQNFIYENNKLKLGGKFKDDFRITAWGKFFRKYWIDEIPMLINLFKGDIKLFGVRPLSKHYFDLYDEELKNLRIKYRPGLIPPYYADLPQSLEDIIESEKKYLIAYSKNKFKTDIKYLYKVLRNIIFNKARSS